MTFLPIVDRELRVVARLPATYRNRALTAALVAAVAVVMMLFGTLSGVVSSVGQAMFSVLSHLALIFCLFEGVRKTADCLSEEKREGTLGLLFLTDLRGYDVVLGKLAAMSLTSFYGLLAIFPLLGLPLLMGGVMGDEFLRMSLALMNILFFSLCAGLCVSSFCRQERQSVGGTVLIIAFVSIAPFVAGKLAVLFPFNPELRDTLAFVPCVSPVNSFSTAFAAAYNSDSTTYWHTMEITQAMCWLLLVTAVFVTPRSWQDRAVRETTVRRRRFGNTAEQAARRAAMLDRNPAFWLAARNFGPRLFHWLFSLLIGLGIAAAIFSAGADFIAGFFWVVLIINFALKMRVATQATRCLTEARRNNALEMLLCTPLNVEEMIRGQLLALKHMFLVPICIILGLELLAFAGAMAVIGGQDPVAPIFGFVAAIITLGIFVLDIFAVIWTGMWFGLSTKKESQAATRTILVVLVAPFASFMACYLGFPVFIVWPIFWLVWSRTQLRIKFRELAGQRYSPKPVDSGWLPPIMPKTTV